MSNDKILSNPEKTYETYDEIPNNYIKEFPSCEEISYEYLNPFTPRKENNMNFLWSELELEMKTNQPILKNILESMDGVQNVSTATITGEISLKFSNQFMFIGVNKDNKVLVRFSSMLTPININEVAELSNFVDMLQRKWNNCFTYSKSKTNPFECDTVEFDFWHYLNEQEIPIPHNILVTFIPNEKMIRVAHGNIHLDTIEYDDNTYATEVFYQIWGIAYLHNKQLL